MRDALYTKTLELGKVDANGTGRKINAVTVEIEIRKGTHGPELSLVGNVWNGIRSDCISCGQNDDEILRLAPTPKVRRIVEVWKAWHLNGMNAGTRAQQLVIEAAKPSFKPYPATFYDQAVTALTEAGLLYDPAEDRDNGEGKPRGYRYGTEWLYRPLPADIVAEVKSW